MATTVPFRRLTALPAVMIAVFFLATACATAADPEPPDDTAAPATTVEVMAESSHDGDEADHDDSDHEQEGDHEHEDEVDHEEGPGGEAVEHDEPQPRLAVIDDTGSITVTDLLNGEEIARLPAAFDGAGEGLLTATEDGRFVFVVDAAGGAVTVVDIGSWSEPHGTHSHHYTVEPSLVGVVEGPAPSHVVAHDGLVAIFFDGTGTATVIDEEALAGGEIATVATIDSGGPHHGVAVPYAGHFLSSAPADDPAALPDRVVAFHDETPEGEVAPCPELHGEFTYEHTVLFACDEDILVVSYEDGEWVTDRVPYPEMDEDDQFGWPNARAWGFFGTPEAGHAISWAGTTYFLIYDHDGEEGRIRTLNLPAPLTFIAWAVEPRSGHGLALAADGALHRVDLESAEIVESLDLIDPFQVDMTFTTVHQLVALDDHAYVLDPEEGVVIEVELGDTLSLRRTFEVGQAGSLSATAG